MGVVDNWGGGLGLVVFLEIMQSPKSHREANRCTEEPAGDISQNYWLL